MNNDRYEIYDLRNQSATVDAEVIDNVEEGAICQCWNYADAEKICKALNFVENGGFVL